MSSGAEALRRACQQKREAREDVAGENSEDRLVEKAFRILEPVIKGWLRSRVRQGSSVVETVAKLSSMLQAGESIAQAAGSIARAVQSVRKVAK